MLPQTGAGDGNRTHVISLEGWSSTIELHPRVERMTGFEPAPTAWKAVMLPLNTTYAYGQNGKI